VTDPVAKSLLALQLSINALTRMNEGSGLSLGEGVTILAPYLETRMDKASVKNGEAVEGEAASAEVIANGLKGVSRVVTSNLHSEEAFRAIKEQGVEVINVSLMPMFVQEANDEGIIDEDTVVLASDTGSLQMCLEFIRLAGLDLKEHMVVLDKGARDQDRNIKGLNLLYGEENLGKNKKIIQIDDIHDTGGSVDKAEALVVSKGVEEIYQFFVHGVFSYPADVNVAERLKRGVVKKIWKSDSLPQAKYQLNADKRIKTIGIAELLSWIAVASVDWSLEDLMNTPFLKDYIMEPRNKYEVWREFCDQVGIDWRIAEQNESV
jgi:ribose-phosphate pyrophosphokinase